MRPKQVRTLATQTVATWGLPTPPTVETPDTTTTPHIWRVALTNGGQQVGHLIINGQTGHVDAGKSSTALTVLARTKHAPTPKPEVTTGPQAGRLQGDTILAGDSRDTLAGNPNTPPDVLTVLAGDADEEIRAHALANPNTPR